MARSTTVKAALAIGLMLVSAGPFASNTSTPRKTLTAFANEQDLKQVLDKWAAERKRREERHARRLDSAAPPMSLAATAELKSADAASGRALAPESIR